MNAWRQTLSRLMRAGSRLLLVAILGAASLVAAAAPALPADIIADLSSLQKRLEQGEYQDVSRVALSQAERLEEGNASDRWASALYLQLAAGAEARLEHHENAADLLYRARQTPGLESQQYDRWLYEEASSRLSAGQIELATQRLAEWLETHPEQEREIWLMVQLLVRQERWDDAASWVDRALDETATLDSQQSALAVTVYQRAGNIDKALVVLEPGLDSDAPSVEWRRAAAMAQQLEQFALAAAIWDAGWRIGALEGAEDLLTLVQLHLRVGTPARAAEYLEQALSQGLVKQTPAHQRQLAQAWQAAKDQARALEAWQTVAERSGMAEDWLRLGQLAHGWGKTDATRHAWEQAAALGAEQARRWLARLE
ncbi:hypothetical protein GPM19_00835 [Halomonas sp. ZH2S]|uniref:Tetratricopeptide repeat protein n=1 Tax=Vreelandella zhuhanensis TaxID=2684210 RepID=A0A7X3GXL0_9GAMM|nr:hypothetical protein [Halomonas zhuhanensis]MWJ26765.1 hypothetical protein [Halomonas zhuhanensis]